MDIYCKKRNVVPYLVDFNNFDSIQQAIAILQENENYLGNWSSYIHFSNRGCSLYIDAPLKNACRGTIEEIMAKEIAKIFEVLSESPFRSQYVLEPFILHEKTAESFDREPSYIEIGSITVALLTLLIAIVYLQLPFLSIYLHLQLIHFHVIFMVARNMELNYVDSLSRKLLLLASVLYPIFPPEIEVLVASMIYDVYRLIEAIYRLWINENILVIKGKMLDTICRHYDFKEKIDRDGSHLSNVKEDIHANNSDSKQLFALRISKA